MPVCRICSTEKSYDSFYASSLHLSGETGDCKDCTKARVRARAHTNPAVQAYDRQRAKTQERRARARQITIKWRIENPDAYRAQTAVGNAVRDGRLKKEPCLFCASDQVHAHHRDYAKPLDVLWLCPKCHHRLHAAFPESEGANKRSAL